MGSSCQYNLHFLLLALVRDIDLPIVHIDSETLRR